MKRIHFIILFLLHYGVLSAQNCPANLWIGTQAEVDSFMINYPNCTEIQGNVTIGYWAGPDFYNPILYVPDSLTGLSQITTIGGDLEILYNNTLNDLSGLDNLQSVGGDLMIGEILYDDWFFYNYGNYDSGPFYYSGNSGLTSLSGLDNLISIGGNLRIEDNGNLSDLSSLSNLDSIGGNISIKSNNALTTLTGLENLQSIGGNVEIGDATYIAVFGSYTLHGNNSLNNIAALSNISNINNNLEIEGNASLENLNGLENINTLQNLNISHNPDLTDLSGLINLSVVSDNVNLINNDALTDLYGLNGITEIGAGLYIDQNDALISLDGLNNLASVGYFRLGRITEYESYYDPYTSFTLYQGNHSLTSLSGLDNLSYIEGDFFIEDNISLSNFNGIENLDSIGGSLAVIANDALVNFDGFDQLSSVGGLHIGGKPYYTYWEIETGNAALISLSGLDSLNTINGEIEIRDNDLLNNLDAISETDYTTITRLIISSNDSLSVCNVESICQYLSWTDNPYTISSNQSGCNSSTEINCAYLPIELTRFQAEVQNLTVLLTWKTATETNNAGFDIERSQDGVNWQKIGWQDGAGNSTTSNLYRYIDEEPLAGTSYYRLRQIDFDGSSAYSDIESVRFEENDTIEIYPNPAKNVLYISKLNGNKSKQILIYDQTGRTVLSTTQTSNKINISDLIPQIYMITIITEGTPFYAKFIVNK